MDNNIEIMKAVTEQLIQRGYQASLEYPGYIAVSRYKLEFSFGTANGETWDADVEGDYSGGVVNTSVAANSTDVNAIADGIAGAIESCKPEPTERERLAWECFLHFGEQKYDSSDITRVIAQVTGVSVSPETEDVFDRLSDEQVAALAAHLRKQEEN